MKFKKILFIATLLFIGSGCQRATTTKNVRTDVATHSLTAPYDTQQWALVQHDEEKISALGGRVDIFYLKSVAPTAQDGLGENEYDARVLIVAGDHIVYDNATNIAEVNNGNASAMEYFAPNTNTNVGTTRNFDHNDLTGNGYQDFIITTALYGASDVKSCTRVIHYDSQATSFSIIANKNGEWCASFNVGIGWYKLLEGASGWQLARTAPTRGGVAGNKISQRFDTSVYAWNGTTFALVTTRHSTQKYLGGAAALAGEISFIKIKK